MSNLGINDWNDDDFKILSRGFDNDLSSSKHPDGDSCDNQRTIDSEDNRGQSLTQLPGQSQKSKRHMFVVIFAAVIALVIFALWGFNKYFAEQDLNMFMTAELLPLDSVDYSDNVVGLEVLDSISENAAPVKIYSNAKEVKIGVVSLLVVTPKGGTPELVVGDIDESDYIIGAQAADIRADNKQISGAFVCKGELLSKGRPRTGFCAIIGGRIIIGMADTTPYLEEALDKDGYFFRQFPLVIAGEIIDQSQRPGNRSFRKALVEMENGFSIVMSQNRVSMSEFAEALNELGAVNAISLGGGLSILFYKDFEGNHYIFGKKWKHLENVNYLVWR